MVTYSVEDILNECLAEGKSCSIVPVSDEEFVGPLFPKKIRGLGIVVMERSRTTQKRRSKLDLGVPCWYKDIENTNFSDFVQTVNRSQTMPEDQTQQTNEEIHFEETISSSKGNSVVVNKKTWGALWGLLGAVTTTLVIVGVKAYRDNQNEKASANASTGDGEGSMQ